MSFENCGQKIKTLAKVLRWIAIAAGLIEFVVGLVQSFSGSSVESAAGTAMLISGLMLVLVGWIGSLFLYGFGIIVGSFEEKETTTPPRKVYESSESHTAASSSPKPIMRLASIEKETSKLKEGICPICGNALDATMKNCPHCSKISVSKLKTTDKGWVCPKCNTINPHHIGTCTNCGEVKPY